jgi:hypothetical protein
MFINGGATQQAASVSEPSILLKLCSVIKTPAAARGRSTIFEGGAIQGVLGGSKTLKWVPQTGCSASVSVANLLDGVVPRNLV